MHQALVDASSPEHPSHVVSLFKDLAA